jgi:hypothetical protein
MKKIFHIIIIATTILMLFLSACGQNSNTQQSEQQSGQSSGQGGKVPEQLTGIEENIEKIIKTLNGPAIELKEEKKQENTSKGSTNPNQQEQSKGSQNKQEQSNQSAESQQTGTSQKSQQSEQSKGSQQSQPSKPEDPMDKLTPIINKLHYQWNEYMPQAVEKGADKKLADGFSSALNSLTTTIIGKNSTNTLMAANYLYAYIPDFYSLYPGNSSSAIKRITYYTRNAILNSITANWAQADTDINSLKASWSLYKNVITKNQPDESIKLDYSISELEKVIKEHNQPLADIKGRVAISNIQAIEKALSKQQE